MSSARGSGFSIPTQSSERWHQKSVFTALLLLTFWLDYGAYHTKGSRVYICTELHAKLLFFCFHDHTVRICMLELHALYLIAYTFLSCRDVYGVKEEQLTPALNGNMHMVRREYVDAIQHKLGMEDFIRYMHRGLTCTGFITRELDS